MRINKNCGKIYIYFNLVNTKLKKVVTILTSCNFLSFKKATNRRLILRQRIKFLIELYKII